MEPLQRSGHLSGCLLGITLGRVRDPNIGFIHDPSELAVEVFDIIVVGYLAWPGRQP